MTEYRMDEAHAGLALDRGVQGILGRPLDRIDGPAKVTGAARYALEHRLEHLVWGVAITAPVGKGRVVAFDTANAEAMPGVLAIYAGDEALPRQTPVFGQDRVQPYDGTIDSWARLSASRSRKASRRRVPRRAR